MGWATMGDGESEMGKAETQAACSVSHSPSSRLYFAQRSPTDPADAGHLVEMRIGAEDGQIVLTGQDGNPDIVGWDGSCALFQGLSDPGVSGGSAPSPFRFNMG